MRSVNLMMFGWVMSLIGFTPVSRAGEAAPPQVKEISSFAGNGSVIAFRAYRPELYFDDDYYALELAVGGFDGVVRFFEPFSGKLIRRFQEEEHHNKEYKPSERPRRRVTAMVFVPVEIILQVGHDNGTLNEWCLETGELKKHPRSGRTSIVALAKSLEGDEAILFPRERSFAWRLRPKLYEYKDKKTGKICHLSCGGGVVYAEQIPLSEAIRIGKEIQAVAFANDPSRVNNRPLSSKRHTHALYRAEVDRAGGIRIEKLRNQNGTKIDGDDKERERAVKVDGSLNAVVFAPDNRAVAVAGEKGVITLIDPAKAAIIRQLEGHSEQVTQLAYCLDGSHLASVSRDGTLRLWDPATGRERVRVEVSKDTVGLCVDQSGRRMATVEVNGKVHFWLLTR